MRTNEPRLLTEAEWDALSDRDLIFARDGGIVIETIIDDDLPGVLNDLLLACCSDGLSVECDGDEEYEFIDWGAVQRNYDASLASSM